MDLVELKSMKIGELYKQAKKLKIEDYSSISRGDLIFKILERQTEKDGLIFANGVLEILPDGIFLRSRSRQAPLVEENGLLVHEGDAVGDLAQAVELARSNRDADVLGLRR